MRDDDEKVIEGLQLQEFVLHARKAVAADSAVLFTGKHRDIDREHAGTAITVSLGADTAQHACFMALSIAAWCNDTLNSLTDGRVGVEITGEDVEVSGKQTINITLP